jgi:hypothetical protein
MAVTVGRIVYEVGADGHVLEKEMHAAAKSAGEQGGKDLNDGLVSEFKRRWGGPSGFEKALAPGDQKIVQHFNKLGYFSSKAYASKFEKSLRPQYAATIKKLTGLFNKLTAEGTVIDLSRNFKSGPEMEAQIRRTKDLMDELAQAFQLGLADTPDNFNTDALQLYRRELEKTLAIIDESTGATQARQRALERLRESQDVVTDSLRKITGATSSYDDMSRQELKTLRDHLRAQELDTSARLAGFEATREQTFAKIDLKDALIQEQKAQRDGTEAAKEAYDQTIKDLEAQRKELLQKRDLEELGKKELKRYNKLTALIDKEVEGRKAVGAQFSTLNKQIVGNEQAVTNWMTSLDELKIVEANLGREYDHQIETLRRVEYVTAIATEAHKEHKAELKAAAQAARENVAAVTEQVQVEEALTEELDKGNAQLTKRQARLAKLADLEQQFADLQKFKARLDADERNRNAGTIVAIQQMIKDRGELSEVTRDHLTYESALSDAVDENTTAMGKNADAVERRKKGIGGLSGMWRSMRKILADVDIDLGKLDDQHGKVGAGAGRLGAILLKPWNSLDNDVRLVIGLIASAADQVAVLGSAAGAGLLGIGGALTAALGGAVGFAVVIGRLNDDLKDLPPQMQAAAKALHAFSSEFGVLRDHLVSAAAPAFASAFTSLEGTLKALIPVTERFGGALGATFRDFAAKVKPGSDGLALIQELIGNAADLLPGLAGATETWLFALIRGINKARPLAQGLVDWVQELGDRFNAFTQSDSFGVWVGNAQRIFGDLGGLLDALGRSMNNLANPASVERTSQLLQNLTDFVPALEGILEILGRLDIVGIVVKALEEAGRAIAPVREQFGLLADALRTGVFTALEQMGNVLVGVATALAPLIDMLAGMVAAIPPPVWTALASAATAYFTALIAFKALSGVTGILVSLSDAAIHAFDVLSGNKVNSATGAVEKLSDKFGKAGLVGAIGAASVAIGLFASDALRDFSKIESKTRDVVANGGSIEDAYKAVQSSFATGAGSITNYGDAFVELKRKQENFLSGSDAIWSETQRKADTLQQTFHELDQPLADLAAKSLPKAQEAFQGMTKDMGLSKDQVQVMLNEMPHLQAAFQEAAGGTDGLATSQEALDYALSNTGGEMETTAANTQLAADALEVLKGRSVDALKGVEGVTDGIKSLGSAFRSQEGANVGYHQSIEDVRKALEENGKSWDISTQAGRDNRLAIMDLAQSTLDYAGEIYNMTGSQEEAAAAIQAGRDAVIQSLEGMDLGGLSAEEYATKLGLIPGDVNTIVSANTTAGMEMADAFAARLVELGLMTPTPQMLADSTEGDKVVSDFQASLIETGLMTPTSTMLADSKPGDATVAAFQKNLTATGLMTPTPKMLADSTKGDATVSTFQKSLTATGMMNPTPVISVNNKQALDGTAAVQTALANVKSKTVTLTVQVSQSGNAVYRQGDRLLEASGDIFHRRTDVTVGEAGPEAIVPLRRPLALVDPAVRALSAFAQGLPIPGRRRDAPTKPAGGGGITFAPGSIVVQGALDPRRTALDVANRIAQKVGG